MPDSDLQKIDTRQETTVPKGRVRLRILTTGDLHAHLTAFDYFTESERPTQGLTRVASLIRDARAQAPNTLLFDNGDLLQGATLGDVCAQAWEDGWPKDYVHPAMAAFNALKMDAATLGNHDFNFGLGYLRDVLEGAHHPVVTANLATALGETPAQDRHLLPPYVILDREVVDDQGRIHPIRIGVIGVVPPQTVAWDHKHLAGKVVARGAAETVRAFVPQMRAQGADLVVVLAHTGFAETGDPDCPEAEHAALAVARVAGVDLMVAGHTHHAFPSQDLPAHPEIDGARGTVAGTPTVMAGQHGSHLGLADFDLIRADGRWLVTSARTEARPVFRRNGEGVEALVEEDRALVEVIAPAHAATRAHMAKVVGISARPLHSYFSMLRPDACLQIVAQAQSDHITSALRGTVHEGLPILSAVSPFRAGGRGGPDAYTEIPEGPITIADIANLYLYPNICCALRVTGAQVADWLEQSAGAFQQIIQGQHDQPLLDPTYPSYNFDVLYGLTYEIDLAQPARFSVDGRLVCPESHRVHDLRLEGKPVDPAQDFIVACSDYRASGAGRFAGAQRETVIYEAPVETRTLIADMLGSKPPFDPVLREVWRFKPMADTSALLRTGPRAIRYLSELSNSSADPIGLDDAGFLQLRLAL